MKSINLLAVGIITIALFVSSCSNHKPAPVAESVKSDLKYTCPMHPQIIKDQPGSCPICGMTLVKKSGQASEGAGISLNTVLEPVNSNVISSVVGIVPVQKTTPTQITGDGYLDFDTRTFNNIASRFSGRIEKLYIKYAFEEIHAGQRIFDIYSPELVTAQQDLIYLSKNSAQETELISAARQKLLLSGMTTAQVNQVVKTGKAFYSLPVYSAYDGHVHNTPPTQMQSDASNKAPTDYTNNLPLSIKEGMYVQKGQTLFNVVNPHQLWAVIKIGRSGILGLKLNQPVHISFPDIAGRSIDGKVDFIEPTLQDGDRTTAIRVYLHNMDHSLKVNSMVKATIQTGKTKGLWIPRSALLNLGKTQVVWLKTGASYQAHQVSTGAITDSEIQITKGLSATDSLASNARYLTDSESFIKTQSHE